MTDYGHDLLFGTFVTPTAQPSSHGLEHALLAEAVGLDLVTFQDHPYQPSFLDTSTLMTAIAARTQRVQLSANVTSLPLRPPVGLARASATLDRLSGGRFNLGIGAGAFWDGIAKMGGRRLTPGQGVSALREAIEIIRQSWDADGPTLGFKGDFYEADEVTGPPPAHAIPIWVGSYKPRMVALTGAMADGWLPSIEYLDGGPAALGSYNSRIDEAASEAGRRPSDVRRLMNFLRVQISPQVQGLLNGPVDVWIDQISTMALNDGLSAFLIGGDDPNVAEIFGKEIAPAVREIVAKERQPRTP